LVKRTITEVGFALGHLLLGWRLAQVEQVGVSPVDFLFWLPWFVFPAVGCASWFDQFVGLIDVVGLDLE